MTEQRFYAVVGDSDLHDTVEKAVAARLAEVSAHMHPWAHIVEVRIISAHDVEEEPAYEPGPHYDERGLHSDHVPGHWLST